MNYEPNTEQWRRGDIVIHDADAKEPKMLMRVIGFTRDGLAKCQYVSTTWHHRRIYPNGMEMLHNPARFGLSADLGRAAEKVIVEAQLEYERVRRWNYAHRNEITVKVFTTSEDGGFETMTTGKAWFGGDNCAWVDLERGGRWLLKFVEVVP